MSDVGNRDTRPGIEWNRVKAVFLEVVDQLDAEVLCASQRQSAVAWGPSGPLSTGAGYSGHGGEPQCR